MIRINKLDGVFLDALSPALVLNCTDRPLQHWALNIQGLDVIMNVNQCGAEPEIAIRNDKVFLGAEQSIFIISLKTGIIENKITDLANVQWIDVGAPNQIVIAAEDEVVVLDNFGKMLWRKNLPDVIQTTDIAAEHLRITDMSGDEYALNLVDGNVFKGPTKTA